MADVAVVKAGALSCGGCDVVKAGALSCGGCGVDARLTAAAFSWRPSAARQTDGKPSGKTDEQRPSGSIDLADVIAVARVDDEGFIVTSVVQNPKHILTIQKNRFTCKSADDWTSSIKSSVEKSSPLRPRRLVVIINPQSGTKKAHKIYQEKAAPLFDLAGIETEVILTERMFHATELLQEYDLSTVQGVVSVGGDGTFKECVTGLISRGMKDAGRVTSDAEERPVTPDVRLAGLPGGTYNAVSETLFNTKDFVSCALHIILGHCEKKLDVASVFSAGHFLGYSFLLLGLGTSTDAIYDAETNRRFNFLGQARYMIPMLKALWNARPIDLEIEWKGSPPEGDSVPDAAASTAHAQGVTTQKVSAPYMDMYIFPLKIYDTEVVEKTPGRWYLYTTKRCSRTKLVATWIQMEMKKFTLEGHAYVDCVPVEGEVTVRITGGGVLRGEDPGKYVLNMDGEVVMLPSPSFTARFHAALLHCFGVEGFSSLSVVKTPNGGL